MATNNPNAIQPPARRRPWHSYLTWWNIFLFWLVGQYIELRLTLASKIEITKTTLRGAARDNTLTITYDRPSLIGPWTDSWIVRTAICIVLGLLLVRWIIKKFRQRGGSN